jgi:C4-dicarboxylate transporter, DctM subunit
MIFSGISGTAISDTASIGSVMIPAMKKEGYDAGFSCAVTAASSTIGPIIPPSLPMIIAGSLTGISIGKLFLAGAIPGILLAIGLAWFPIPFPSGRNIQSNQSNLEAKISSFIDAFWALLMTLLILFGIIGGVFTPTEASVVAVLYALFIGTFFYRTLTWKNITSVITNSSGTTASLMLLVGFANLFGWILIIEQVPQNLAELLLTITQNKFLLLLLINILLMVIGSFMETIAALLIIYPIFTQCSRFAGVDPIQFSVIAVLNLIIGLNTPPVGVCFCGFRHRKSIG